jgi:hypothetical protein
MNLIKRLLLPDPCLGLMLVLAIAAGSATPALAQDSGFTGLWTGTLRVFPCRALIDSSRCQAINKITITIIQDGPKISGHYTCAIGTQICRNGNADNAGKITGGRRNGNSIRFSVMVPADLSNCDYNGFTDAPGHMRGSYSCYQGGSLAEQGSFDVSREGG